MSFIKAIAQMIKLGRAVPPTGELPDLGGTGKATFVGDSVVAGSAASSPALAWPALVAAGLNGIEDNEGQGGRGVFNYILSSIETRVPEDKILFLNLVINSLYSSPESETDPPTLGSKYWQFAEGLQAVLDDIFSKGWLPGEVVIDTCYHILFLATNGAPWRIKQYSNEILRVCKENGCIYADLHTYMYSFPDRDSCLADNVHQNDLGMQRTADFHLNELDYTPQINDIDSSITHTPYYTTASENINFEDVGVDADNIEIIFKADDPLQCYVPDKTGNTITGMVDGTDYYVVPKVRNSTDFNPYLNLNLVGLPRPIANPTDGSAEAAAFVAATGRISQSTAIQNFIEALMAAGFWWRMYGFWILDTSYNVSKYNLRDATATVTEYGGAGTYDATGWTGSATKALLMGISPDDYDKTCSMIVAIVGDAHESRADFGMSGGTSYSQIATRMDWSDPPVSSFVYVNWNSGGSYTMATSTAVGRWMIAGGKDYVQSYRDGVPFNNYYAGPHVSAHTIGEFTVGNAGVLTGGSSKKFRLAGIFHFMEEHESEILDGLVADFQASL